MEKEDEVIERVNKLFSLATNDVRSGDGQVALMALEEALKALSELPKKEDAK